MNRVKFLLYAMAFVALAACTADPTTEGNGLSGEVDAVAKKFVNSSASAIEGRLIIFVDEATAETLTSVGEDAVSSVAALDKVAAEVESMAIEPLFPARKDDMRAREYDMHRYFVLSFAESANLDEVARKIASLDFVQSVEFSHKIKTPEVQPIQADMMFASQTRSKAAMFNDPMLEMQWHYNNTGNEALFPNAKAGADINLAAAWELTAGDPSIIVAVMDEGVNYRHEDLKDNMWKNEKEANGLDGVDDDDNGYVDDIYGFNFVTNGAAISCNREGDTGHGHHIAGTIAAVNNNGVGVAGVAGGTGKGDGVRIMSVQYSSGREQVGTEGLAKCIRYAADNGASILQCSWGFATKMTGLEGDSRFEQGTYSIVHKALKYFMETKNCPALDGGLVVFAAGNDAMSEACYPAAYNEYIAVTSFAPDGYPAYYSNYGRGCNVAAPGGAGHPSYNTGQVLSLGRGNKEYAYMQGTSMACPHVSGVAALALSYALKIGRTLSLSELKAILLTSVNDINGSLTGTRDFYSYNPDVRAWEQITLNMNNYKGKMGTGMIDAYQVLMAVRGTTCVPVKLNDDAAIDVNAFLGDGKENLKIMGVVVGDDVREKLGVEGEPMVADNMVCIKCTKPGCDVVKVQLIAGGKSQGGGMSIGGMLIEKEIALIVREGNDAPAGWL